jgi:hypothetical protein
MCFPFGHFAIIDINLSLSMGTFPITGDGGSGLPRNMGDYGWLLLLSVSVRYMEVMKKRC